MRTFAIPVAVFEVECEIANGLPFSMAERTVLRSLDAGNARYEAVVDDLAIHPRIVAECLTALFEAGLVEFGPGGAFGITTSGREALTNPSFVPGTLRCERKPYTVIVDRITGSLELGWNVRYERIDELRAAGAKVLPPGDLDPLPGRAAVRRLLEGRAGLRDGDWVRSVGHPEAVSCFNQAVRVDVHEGRLERVRSAEWQRQLSVALAEHGVTVTTGRPSDAAVDAPRWTNLAVDAVRKISGAPEHCKWLTDELMAATTYVFIHSAFLTGNRVAALVEPIKSALARRVDVLIARGSDEGEGDAAGVEVFKKLAHDVRAKGGGRFYFQAHPTASHAKLLLRDGAALCVGSFNWLSGQSDSPRPELSVAVRSDALADEIADLAADLFRDAGPAWPAQMLRGKASAAPASATPAAAGVLFARVVRDGEHRDRLFQYLDEAVTRVVVGSDKVTPRKDPLLSERLGAAARRLQGPEGLTLCFDRVDGENAPILEGLESAGARIRSSDRNHAKYVLRDRSHALVTSFNLLSFGGHSPKRTSAFEVGIELRADSGALPNGLSDGPALGGS